MARTLDPLARPRRRIGRSVAGVALGIVAAGVVVVAAAPAGAVPSGGDAPEAAVIETSPSASTVSDAPGVAHFGPAFFDVTAPVVLAVDDAPPTADACGPLTNTATGTIVVVERGSCPFPQKVLDAQRAGAVAVVVVNNVATAPPDMAPVAGPAITIGSLLVPQDTGTALEQAVGAGPVTLRVFRHRHSGDPAVASDVVVGGHPQALAADPRTGAVYTPNTDDDSVSVIDESTSAVTGTISVGGAPCAVGIDPSTGTVFVANYSDDTVSVIDETSRTVTDTVSVGAAPDAVAVDPSTGTVYVADYSDATVSVIDETSRTVTHTVAVGAGPSGLAVDPTSGAVYVANTDADTVSVIDPTSLAVTRTVGVGSQPVAVAVDPSTGTAYVADSGGNSVSVIDGSSGVVTATVPVGAQPWSVAVDAALGAVYVTNLGAGTVSVIDESTGEVTSTLQVGTQPASIAVSPGSDLVFTALYGADTVVVIDDGRSRSQAITFTSPAPATPRYGDEYTVTASGGDSGRPVTFRADPSAVACTVSDRGDGSAVVTFTDLGRCAVDAAQAAGNGYLAATDARLFLTPVTQAYQRIAFTSTLPADPSPGGSPYLLTATGGGSANPVRLSAPAADAGVCTVADRGDSTATVTFTGNGRCLVRATQAGDADHTPAPPVTLTLQVKTPQQITFTSAPPARPTPGTSYLATVTGGSSGKPVVLSAPSSDNGICTVADRNNGTATVTLIGNGRCTVHATQAGTVVYTAATPQNQTLQVMTDQTVTFSTPTHAVVGTVFTLDGKGGSSGQPVVFTAPPVDNGICAVTSNGTVSTEGTGTCVITAKQNGTSLYRPATPVTHRFTVFAR